MSGLDETCLMIARTRLHAPRAERVVAAYSHLGEHGACWVALGFTGAALDRRPGHRRAWLHGAATVLGALGLNFALKLVVRRPRPELPGLPPLTPTVSSLSFPSAHASTSFAAARAFCGLAPPGALYAAAAGLALSRPYLGVHYPSDVLAGALIGTGFARLSGAR